MRLYPVRCVRLLSHSLGDDEYDDVKVLSFAVETGLMFGDRLGHPRSGPVDRARLRVRRSC